MSPATLAKHLRQLGACLQAAVAEGYATENPVRMLHKSAKPKVPKAAPTVLHRTPSSLGSGRSSRYRPAMLALCKTAVGTGLRFGELAALRWGDVDLLNRELHISRTFVQPGIGESAHEERSRARSTSPHRPRILEQWYAESGRRRARVRRARMAATSRPATCSRRMLYPALERAGIPRRRATRPQA